MHLLATPPASPSPSSSNCPRHCPCTKQRITQHDWTIRFWHTCSVARLTNTRPMSVYNVPAVSRAAQSAAVAISTCGCELKRGPALPAALMPRRRRPPGMATRGGGSSPAATAALVFAHPLQAAQPITVQAFNSRCDLCLWTPLTRCITATACAADGRRCHCACAVEHERTKQPSPNMKLCIVHG